MTHHYLLTIISVLPCSDFGDFSAESYTYENVTYVILFVFIILPTVNWPVTFISTVVELSVEELSIIIVFIVP